MLEKQLLVGLRYLGCSLELIVHPVALDEPPTGALCPF
jgi:hypothetical protein